MPQYYLRFEGVNLGNFVYDTNDLSTIRGGGLINLKVVEKVEQFFISTNQLVGTKAISKGASWGLFKLDLDASEASKTVCDLHNQLKKDQLFKYATFVIDLIPINEDKEYIHHRDSLVASNRWEQMNSPSLVYPGKGKDVYSIDKVRPSNLEKNLPNGKLPVSEASWIRREYGREQKQSFYSELTDMQNLNFTNDLGEISNDPSKGILHNKIALIYIDGNGFGDFLREHCKDEEAQRIFDTSIRNGQKKRS